MENIIEYFKGVTDTEIRTLKDDIKEMKDDIKEMKVSFNIMENWKNKIIGMTMAMSLVVSIAAQWVIAYFKS